MRNVPRLRFKEFTDEWEEKRLGNYLIEFKEKIPYTTNLPKLTSSRKGLLFQKDYYDNREVKTETEYGLLPRGYFTYRHMSDDLIFKFNINDLVDNGAISKEYPVFTTKNFDSRFLYYLLNYGDDFKKFAIEQKQGGTRTRLYFKKLITFSPKAPILNEQNKIGKFIFNIDKKISIAEEKLGLFNEYKKGIMQKIFNQELRFKDENGNDYPEWEEKELKELLESVVDNRGKTPPNLEDNTLIPLLEINSIGEREIKYEKVTKFVTEETYNTWFRNYIVKDDILFSTVGATALCSMYRDEKKSVIAQNLVGLRVKENYVPDYIYSLLVETKNNLKFKSIEMVAVQPSIKVSQMINLKFKISVSYEEQQKIADFLSSIDTKIEKISDELENLKEFKKGLLQQMFV